MNNSKPVIKEINYNNKVPFINKRKKKPKVRYNSFVFNHKHTRLYHKNRPNRDLYLSQHPLDELLLLEDIYKPANNVHHIYPIEKANTDDERVYIATQLEDNLMSLTEEMHRKLHNDFDSLTEKQKDYVRVKYKNAEAKFLLYKYQRDNNIDVIEQR